MSDTHRAFPEILRPSASGQSKPSRAVWEMFMTLVLLIYPITGSIFRRCPQVYRCGERSKAGGKCVLKLSDISDLCLQVCMSALIYVAVCAVSVFV